MKQAILLCYLENCLGCKWVYKINPVVVSEGTKPDNSKEIYSERRFWLFRNLVITGQNDPYPILLFVAAIQGWYLYQLDVNSAFLDGILKEEVSITLPYDFNRKGGP